jgi:hypothetical protein
MKTVKLLKTVPLILGVGFMSVAYSVDSPDVIALKSGVLVACVITSLIAQIYLDPEEKK